MWIARDGTWNERTLYNFIQFFDLRFYLLRFTLYLKTKLQFSLVSGFVTIFRHSRLVLKDFVCESVFISALRFLFCSNHKRCRTVYFTKNYTKIEILAIWKVSDLYPKWNFNQGCPVRECLRITDTPWFNSKRLVCRTMDLNLILDTFIRFHRL